ncbi:MAG TPA: heme o synthase [Ktedonobacteraceae bacterium]
MTKFRRSTSWIASGAIYFLIALGGTILATRSGLNCTAWPFCSGHLSFTDFSLLVAQLPPFTAVTAIVLSVLLVFGAGLLGVAQKQRSLLTLAVAAPILLAFQVILGGVTALWQLPPQIIVALVIFASMITLALLSSKPMAIKEHPARTRAFARLTITSTLCVYVLLLLGSYASGGNANGELLHGVFGFIVGLLMLWTVVSALSRWRIAPGQAIVGLLCGVLFVAQAVIGGLIALGQHSVLITVFHLVLATTVWCVLVLLAALASNQLRALPQSASAQAEEPAELSPARQIIASYIDLMKPHVTVLLLGITAAAMTIAARGLPALTLVFSTLLGGALAAGSANCINCYIDRDIDQIMGRTQRRSLPAGRVEPRQALIFGILLGVISFLLLTVFVNLLSAALALSAILFYVFIYTLWLKRTSVQNIVIGGAAGAVPVLVGWAAVTNAVSPTALWLFAIIFFWTPPHFWALALLIQKDYERAGIPMLPVVKGEAETRWQILLYSLLLLLITLGLFVTHAMGSLYLVGSLLLGGGLVYLAARLWREHSKKWARTLFWYSNMYLAAIFTIMVLDRILH